MLSPDEAAEPSSAEGTSECLQEAVPSPARHDPNNQAGGSHQLLQSGLRWTMQMYSASQSFAMERITRLWQMLASRPPEGCAWIIWIAAIQSNEPCDYGFCWLKGLNVLDKASTFFLAEELVSKTGSEAQGEGSWRIHSWQPGDVDRSQPEPQQICCEDPRPQKTHQWQFDAMGAQVDDLLASWREAMQSRCLSSEPLPYQ